MFMVLLPKSKRDVCNIWNWFFLLGWTSAISVLSSWGGVLKCTSQWWQVFGGARAKRAEEKARGSCRGYFLSGRNCSLFLSPKHFDFVFCRMDCHVDFLFSVSFCVIAIRRWMSKVEAMPPVWRIYHVRTLPCIIITKYRKTNLFGKIMSLIRCVDSNLLLGQEKHKHANPESCPSLAIAVRNILLILRISKP